MRKKQLKLILLANDETYFKLILSYHFNYNSLSFSLMALTENQETLTEKRFYH